MQTATKQLWASAVAATLGSPFPRFAFPWYASYLIT
jgi:hypothetical protein